MDFTLSQGEDYAGARSLVDAGRAKFGPSGASNKGSEYLSALSKAYAYRIEIKEIAANGMRSKPADLKGGGQLVVLKKGRAPDQKSGDDGWQRICPVPVKSYREGSLTCGDWMPKTGALLEGEGAELWLLVKASELATYLEFELKRLSLVLSRLAAGAFVTTGGGESTLIDLEKLRHRAAVEGLGVRAAALLAAQTAASELEHFFNFSRCIELNKGELTVTAYGGAAGMGGGSGSGIGVHLVHPAKRRSFELAYSGWLELFSFYPDEWSQLWAEIGREFARPPRSYRCFCGREVFLRESYLPEIVASTQPPADGILADRALGQWGMVAYCPKHRMYVGGAKFAEWGVTAKEAAEKCDS